MVLLLCSFVRGLNALICEVLLYGIKIYAFILFLCRKGNNFGYNYILTCIEENRIKAKGLQKLRWYCQMFQKQCRDENGFKCHCLSESHQRQMEVFGQNPHRIVDGYSEEFESSFLEHMKRNHRFSRIAATVVYNEYIADRHHVHMNSTQWATLTEFAGVVILSIV